MTNQMPERIYAGKDGWTSMADDGCETPYVRADLAQKTVTKDIVKQIQDCADLAFTDYNMSYHRSTSGNYEFSPQALETIQLRLATTAPNFDALVKVLEKIANTEHCQYKDGVFISDHDSGYKMGVADGHRLAASWAREALAAHRAQQDGNK